MGCALLGVTCLIVGCYLGIKLTALGIAKRLTKKETRDFLDKLNREI